MERNNELCPAWVEPLIRADFYGHNGICETHNKYCTYFCKNCTTKPFCELCWKVAAEDEHEGHPHLRIFIVSNKASVRKADIEREVDITDIQPYTVNDHKVILLKPKGRNGRDPKCIICQGKIKDEQYQFCSISCKVSAVNTFYNSVMFGDAERLRHGLCESETIEEIEAEVPSYSLRTKPRKRRPCRSPLF
ncbi:hypothetical protein RND71_039846 [Anisodus tanguticus]|uniref:PLATZ transcription factor family protein n=1 Tax=Anisodus tanguticus TaxID=243964 RepID=A0AAE1QXA0_9SOLA|nr:hypothetical protein RND71_039846 [Anisodus tanguticus]